MSRKFSKSIQLVHEYLLTPILSFIFPSECPVCLEPLGKYHSGGVCLDCWASIKVIREPFCSKCGLPFDIWSDAPSADAVESRDFDLSDDKEAPYDEEQAHGGTISGFAELPIDKEFSENGDSHEEPMFMVCGRCQTKKLYFSRARAFGEYSGPLKEIIRLYKFGGNKQLALPLAELMFRVLKLEMEMRNFDSTTRIENDKSETRNHEKDPAANFDLIVPIPLHRKREHSRGFNQSFLIARQIGKTLGVRVERNLLVRTKDRIPQSELPAENRESNVRGVFQVKRRWRLAWRTGGRALPKVRWTARARTEAKREAKRKANTDGNVAVAGKKILLIDDIFTTGATVSECARVLLKAGAKEVIVLTIAHTPLGLRQRITQGNKSMGSYEEHRRRSGS